MLAHFARDVGQNVTLTGQIDAKHRARQHLGYRAFSYDLRLFSHAIKCQRAAKVQPTPRPTIENDVAALYERRTSLRTQRRLREKFTNFAPLPPSACGPTFF